MTADREWPPQEDGDEELDDDWDWDTELGLLEPGRMLGPREAPQPFVRWPRPPRERDRQLAVLTPEGVGEFLRGCRAAAGMSQRQVAEGAGVPCSTVSRIEAGRGGDVRLSTVVRLADACDVILVGTTGSYEPLIETDLAQRRRDAAGRLLPAHLLNRPITADHGEWWADDRYTVNAVRARPTATFDRDFRYRDLPDDG